MDMQALVDSISKAGELERSHYHLTLQKLINKLSESAASKEVVFDVGGYPHNPDSYRGYYSDLAFSNNDTAITAGEFLDVATACLGKTFYGYKGGDFVMRGDTPLWMAEYGTTLYSRAIMGMVDSDNKLILITKEID